jgi:hypothetical protein
MRWKMASALVFGHFCGIARHDDEGASATAKMARMESCAKNHIGNTIITITLKSLVK